MSTMTLAQQLSGELTFSDEQSMLLDTAMDFFREQSGSSQVRERMMLGEGFDPAQWQQMVDLGWLGLAIPESLGGSELGLGAAATIAEPMGRFLSATPFLATQLFIQGVLQGSPALAEQVLPQVAAGAVGSVALAEEDGDWNLNAVTATAALKGSQATLSGQKFLVLNAEQAQFFLVSVQVDGVTALAMVQADELPPNALQAELSLMKRDAAAS